MSINPYYMPSFIEWASLSLPSLERYGPIADPPDEDDWKTWATSVVLLSSIAALGAPSPYEFSDWKDWAARLIEVLNDGF
jgi:hypothetical protein